MRPKTDTNMPKPTKAMDIPSASAMGPRLSAFNAVTKTMGRTGRTQGLIRVRRPARYEKMSSMLGNVAILGDGAINVCVRNVSFEKLQFHPSTYANFTSTLHEHQSCHPNAVWFGKFRWNDPFSDIVV